METRIVNPIQELFSDIQKILEFLELKDQRTADLFETNEISVEAEKWMGALTETDSYTSYKDYWTIAMFQEIVPNIRWNRFNQWKEKPLSVPSIFRDNLLKRGREIFLSLYTEKNSYYRRVNGLPPIDTEASNFIYLSDELCNEFDVSSDTPVHNLSTLLQNRYMSTEEYKTVVESNPDKLYLKYLGLYKIDIFVARKARDFELIRFIPMGRSDVNPNLLKEFGNLYPEYRNYVMWNLYNKNLEGIYENYRSFMKVLIMSWVIMQLCNKSVEMVRDRRFLDDSILHIILSMYGIPSTLLMTKEVRRSLVVNLPRIIKEKATDDVYYSLVDILDYHDIIISKLLLMKGQTFDKDGSTSFDDELPMTSFEDIDSINYHNRLQVDPYFIKVDIKDPNPYDTISNGDAPILGYREIIDTDHTWWDLQDTQDLLRNTHYTIANSKYIMLESVIHQMRYLFESIYFTRMILDNKQYTDTFDITLPEIFGTDPISIYDIMVYILAATCMSNNMTGEIMLDQGVCATAGFNYDLNIDAFNEYLNSTKYVDKEKILIFLENLSMNTPSDIGRLFNEVMSPMREWLEDKISTTDNREEFLEYESIYRGLYSYDISRNKFLEDFHLPMSIIQNTYNLTDDDIQSFKHYYPRTYGGAAITEEEYYLSRYNPFIDATGHPVTWNINIPYKGRLYFHDILNSDDVRTLKSDDGTYLFIDDFNEIDREAVNDAISLINGLNNNEFRDAIFKVDTPILNSDGEEYEANTKLPANLRNSVFKQILISKIEMDIEGLCYPPKTYLEYLYRKNRKLYELLTKDNRFIYQREAWTNDLMTTVLALETELNMHMKYFEQSVVGSDLFFKPLITLIQRFKSTYVNFAKTGLRYMFADKMDITGSSNMLRLFDDITMIIHFVLFAKRGEYAQFGLYDTIHKTIKNVVLRDFSDILVSTKDGTDVKPRTYSSGSIRMVDEIKLYKNGREMDKSPFTSGEFGTGRWEDDELINMRNRTSPYTSTQCPIDYTYWKNMVESTNR